MQSNTKFIARLKKKSIYKDLFKKNNISSYQYTNPIDFFNKFWRIYESYAKTKSLNNSIPGNAFEIVIGFLLDYESIQITSMDETISGVFKVKPDFLVLNAKNDVIFISCKTSFRERWKQADWECIQFKKKYPKAKSFVICNHLRETNNLKKDLHNLCIDKIYYAQSKDIDSFIRDIKK
tara:strand:+ start:1112 stop:1648 length:537 start_codon:yes stop_codon:yes gene_type:complete